MKNKETKKLNKNEEKLKRKEEKSNNEKILKKIKKTFGKYLVWVVSMEEVL